MTSESPVPVADHSNNKFPNGDSTTHNAKQKAAFEKSVDSPAVSPDEIDAPIKPGKKSLLARFKKNKEVKDNDPNSEDALSHEPQVKTPYFVWVLMGPEWFWCLTAAFFSAVSGAVPMIFQVLFGDIMNVVSDTTKSESEIRGGINNLVYKLIGVAVGAAVANGLASFFSGIAAARLGTRLKKIVYAALLKQEMGYFDVRKSGTLVKRLSEDTQNIETAYAVKLGTMLQFATQFVVGMIMAFTYSWLMTLVLLAMGPILMVVMVVIGGSEQIFTKLATKSSDQASIKAAEVIATMKTVRAASGEDKELKFFKRNFEQATKMTYIRGVFKFLGFFAVFFLIWGAAAMSFWFGGLMMTQKITIQKDFQMGTLLQVFGCLLFAIIGAAMSLPLMQEFAKANRSSIEILKIYKRKPRVVYRGGDSIEELKGEIEFKNVNFSYPSRPTIQVLKNFSLVIPAGKTTALVGQSGSGKSTITSLVEHFYKVDSGEVLMDGKDLYSLDPKWLHTHVGIVTQEPTLFSGTIEDNIRYGIPPGRTVTHAEVVEAAKMANAHNFISAFKDGYNTLLGESSGLSGGQKQRIAIARMCLLDPKIVLQDESTSALDSESERLVQEALNKLTVGRTAIVIAHRLSTIKDADQIVVMERGEIVEIGTHDELLSKGPKGAYFKLAEKQMLFGNEELEALQEEELSVQNVDDETKDQA